MITAIDRNTARAWAEIDLSVIRKNYLSACEYAARYGAGVMAIMKAITKNAIQI